MGRAPFYSVTQDEIMSRACIEDPYSLYARLRNEHPIARIGESGVHAVANWELVDEALGREADFSANLTGVLFRGEDGDPSVFDLSAVGGSHVIATADDPDHAVHRKISQPRLDARRIAKMEPLLRAWTREALSPWIAQGGGDCVPIAERVPALAIANLLGLPETDVDRFRVWAMMGGDILAGEADAERLGFLARETSAMALYLGEHFDRAFEAPSDAPDAPLLHALALGVRACRIERQEAIGIAIVMFGAGGESTAALLGSAMRRLAEDPELAEQLRSDVALIPRFLEEVLRLDSPFNFHYRLVRQECSLGGYDLVPGDRLMLLWASANRDATQHETPDALLLDRKHPKKHMGFGRGMHFCIGAPLARLEARVLIEETLAQTSLLQPRTNEAGDETTPYLQYANSIFIRRLEKLDLEVTHAGS